MSPAEIIQANDAALDARWRELQKESSRTPDDAVVQRNAHEMADIVRELENRRKKRESRG